jgi:CheY-like chemotaxis protein
MASTKLILAVDDDAFFRDILARFLQNAGYHVEGAGDGLEALEYLQSEPKPDLILLDLRMERLDGWGFRQRQLQDPKIADIPVIVLSGVVELPEATEGLHATAYLEKPCDLDLLVSIIQRLIPNQPRLPNGA